MIVVALILAIVVSLLFVLSRKCKRVRHKRLHKIYDSRQDCPDPVSVAPSNKTTTSEKEMLGYSAPHLYSTVAEVAHYGNCPCTDEGYTVPVPSTRYWMTQNHTWINAKLACLGNKTQLLSLPLTPAERAQASEETSALQGLWVDLKTRVADTAEWINSTGLVKEVAKVVGDCGILRDEKIQLLNCSTERPFICSVKSTAGKEEVRCIKQKLSWFMATEYCKNLSGTLLQETKSNCSQQNSGYWIGVHRQIDILSPANLGHMDKFEVLKTCHRTLSAKGEYCGIIELAGHEVKCLQVLCNLTYLSMCTGTPTSTSQSKSGRDMKYFIAMIAGIVIIVTVIILGFVLSHKYNKIKRERLQSMRDSHPYRPDRMSVAPPPYSPGGSAGAASSSLFPVQYSQTADNLWITEKPEVECEAEMYCDISDSDSMTKRPEMPSPRRSTIYDRLETPSDTSGSEGKIYQNRPGRPTPRRKRAVGPASKHSPAVMCSPSHEYGSTPRRSRSGKYGYTPSPTIAHSYKQQSPLPMHVRNQVQTPSPSSVRGPAHQHAHAHAHGNAPPQKEGPNIQSHGGYRDPLSFTGSMTRQKVKGRQQAESPASYASVYKYNRAISAEVKPGQAESLGVSAYFASDESDEDF